MNILDILLQHKYGLTLSAITTQTHLNVFQVQEQLNKYRQSGIIIRDYGMNEKGELTWYYYINPEIVLIKSRKPNVYVANPKPQEDCWSSEKFLKENKRLQQMLDIEYMLTLKGDD